MPDPGTARAAPGRFRIPVAAPSSRVPKSRRLAPASIAAVILLVTLAPSRDAKLAPLLGCLLCGERGLADFALNVLLFVPLGAALAWAGERGRTALGTGALLSLGIEIAQLAIPGRDSSLSDVVSNTIGSLVGWLAVTHGPRVVALPSRTAALLTPAAAVLPSLVVAATGALFRPDFPYAHYYGGCTPDFGHMARYG